MSSTNSPYTKVSGWMRRKKEIMALWDHTNKTWPRVGTLPRAVRLGERWIAKDFMYRSLRAG